MLSKLLVIILKPFFESIRSMPMVMLTIFLLGVFAFSVIRNLAWTKRDDNGQVQVIDSDGKGYYAYLPSLFVTQDFGTKKADYRYILKTRNNQTYNKYYCGTALAMSPFFGMSYMVSSSGNTYSNAYQYGISWAGLFYFLAGLYFLAKLLQYYRFSQLTITITLVAMGLGTNLFAYATLMPSMSHVYSFAFITALLVYVKRLFETRRNFHFYVVLVLLAMVILIRPLNGLVVLLFPFFADSKEHFIRVFKAMTKPSPIVNGVLVFFAILFIQPMLWWLQTGSFFLWTYPYEGFNFGSPEITEVLFGFRKGWFIYTPMAFVALFGLIRVFKHSKFQFLSLITFLVVLIYFTSSWWNWYYGPSFGQRPFVDFYGIIGLMFAIFFQPLAKWAKRLFLLVVGFFLFLNLLQTYQYHVGIISSWNMTKEKYSYTFLKVGASYQNCLGGYRDAVPYNAKKELIFTQIVSFKDIPAEVDNPKLFVEYTNILSDYVNEEYNFHYMKKIELESPSERGLFVDVAFKRKQLRAYACENVHLVIEVKGKDDYISYRAFKIDDLPVRKKDSWEERSYKVEVPDFRGEEAEIQCFLWNKNRSPFYLDDFEITVFNIK